MARPLRIQYRGAVYHVMNRGGSRQKVFFDKQDYEAFFKTIGEIHDRWAVEVFVVSWATTIMCACARPREISPG
jgi:REP element-mobilizing transposase RayT